MSYSRWLYSDFYTYWCSSNTTDINEELFALHEKLDNEIMIRYDDACKMIEDKEFFMDYLQEIIRDEADYHELVSYLIRWTQDVKEHYEKKEGNT